MANENLNAGDVVYLKSDLQRTLLMTIEKIEGTECICCWFHPVTMDFISKRIQAAALQKAS